MLTTLTMFKDWIVNYGHDGYNVSFWGFMNPPSQKQQDSMGMGPNSVRNSLGRFASSLRRFVTSSLARLLPFQCPCRETVRWVPWRGVVSVDDPMMAPMWTNTLLTPWRPWKIWLHLAEFPEFPEFMSAYLQDYFIGDEVFSLNLSLRLTWDVLTCFNCVEERGPVVCPFFAHLFRGAQVWPKFPFVSVLL